MDTQIIKIQTEQLAFPIRTTSVIKECSSHFEQFITTQPGMVDLVNQICQSLTYNDSKSAKYVNKEFKVWISNSELFRLACEADSIIGKIIASINGSCFRMNFGLVLTDIYKIIICDCNVDLLKIFVEIMKNYLEVDMASSIVTETDELMFGYAKYMMNLCFLFEILALFAGFRFKKMGVKDVQKMSCKTIVKNIIGM